MTESMFALGRRYAKASREEQDTIIKHALLRINRRASDEGIILLSRFIEGAMSINEDASIIFEEMVN